ncbi:hypothetical protein FM111_04525 [Brevundimonas diminuta 3F5N]|uniref:Uncharacterized protein n=2 Tax=Brevundimonas diminuta TaxID=293 RepID=A0A1R4FFY1_BREDI|nr:hypothetical protein FM111_04525 [Brevundimonas diminuta 3F5N]
MDLFRNAYDLPHDGDIVIDFVGLTDAEGEDEEKGESVSGPDGTGQ